MMSVATDLPGNCHREGERPHATRRVDRLWREWGAVVGRPACAALWQRWMPLANEAKVPSLLRHDPQGSSGGSND